MTCRSLMRSAMWLRFRYSRPAAMKSLLRLAWLVAVLLLSLALPHPSHAQQQPAVVAVNAVSMRAPEVAGLTRLELYAQVPYKRLRFVPSPLGFVARYQVAAEISILDELGRPSSIVRSPIWDRTVTVPVFAQTESETQRDATTHAVLLEPGRYLVAFEITDRHGGGTWFREYSVEVKDLDRPFALSDLVLLNSYDPTTQFTDPKVSNVLPGSAASVDIYYEVYADEPHVATLVRTITPLSSGLSSDAAPVFSDTSFIDVSAGRSQMVTPFGLEDLDVGSYALRLHMDTGAHSDASERAVVSQWMGLGAHISNLDLAIEQMVYAASRRELRRIQQAGSEGERRRLFNEFWQERDPTPTTSRNERMEEYYYRVDVATRRYSAVRPGWQTDRGHVLILHGDPEDTRRQTFSFNAKPYEVWYYYRLGRQYVFVDRTGFGDYELLVPIWDERTRIR